MRELGRGAATLASLLFGGAPAAACPLCDSETGERVRTGVGDGFADHLLAAALPFAVLFAVVAFIRFAPPRRRGPPEDAP